MGIENNQFNGIVLYYYKTNTQPFEIYIGSIDLIGRRNKPDAGVCLFIPFSENEGSGEEGGPKSDNTDNNDISITIINDNDNISNNISESDNMTEIASEKSESNETSLTYVNILNIKQINRLIINIKCENHKN